jgi:hypothetical protein
MKPGPWRGGIARWGSIATFVTLGLVLVAPPVVGAKHKGNSPEQPQVGSVWSGHRGRVHITIKVMRYYSPDTGRSVLSANLTWPKVKGKCEVYDPKTHTFHTKTEKFTVHEDSASSTSAGRIHHGKFKLEDTYGGKVYRLYEGTFTRNRVKGTDQVFGPPAQCVYGPLHFDLLRQ